MKKYRGLSILVLAIVILAVAFVFYDKLNLGTKQTINSRGSYTIKAEPDEVSVYVRIETLEDTAEKSKEENSKISENVIAFLKAANINDIETQNYNIYPEYEWKRNGRELKGYKTMNNLRIRTEDFDLVGKIVDISVNSGATGIDSISFELSEEKQSKLKQEALAKASEDARLKAESIARGLNAKLGKVVSVSESGYWYEPYPMFMAKGDMAIEEAAAEIHDTEIIPRELEVRANVNVVFALK